MAACSRCGNPVTFRYVDGRCVPLHLSGECTGGFSRNFTNNSRHIRSDERCCFLTDCPKCNEPVFFLRHNGGSVWIDPPLGPPWYKHPCMDSVPVPAATGKRTLVPITGTVADPMCGKNVVLGVVVEVEVSFSKMSSVITIETDKERPLKLLMKHNADFLAGKLILYKPVDKTVVIFGDDAYGFTVVAGIPDTRSGDAWHESVNCPECGSTVNTRNLKRHLLNQHSYQYL